MNTATELEQFQTGANVMRPSIRKQILSTISAVIAVVIAVAVVATVLFSLPVALNKYLVAGPEAGPLGYTGSIFLLLDFTKSELESVREAIRETAKKGVVANISPGIYTAAYSLGTDPDGFDEVANRIFGDTAGPGQKVHLNVANEADLTPTSRAEFPGQWKALRSLTAGWNRSIDALRPPQNRCCSAYSSAVAYIESRLSDGSLPGAVTVVIIGALSEEPAPDPYRPPPPQDSQRRLYSGVRVLLVRPFSVRGPHSRAEIDAYFREYFHERGTEAQIHDLNGFPGIGQGTILMN